MISLSKTYLNFIELIQLENWSVQSLLESRVIYSNRFELAKIDEFLIRNREIVNIEDDKIYQRVTIKINNNGVVPRDTEKGINIGTKKQYLVKSGQFIISKIDARNGAFGIVPDELDGAIVTNDFPLFNVNEKRVNPHFLLLITTTKEFIKFAQSCSSGTTNRQRMDIEQFLNQKIPLPSLFEQNEIVNNYNKKVKEAKELQQKANDFKGEIENYLFKELGVEIYTGLKKSSLLQYVHFGETNRWDTLFLLGKIPTLKSKYNLACFSEAIKFFNKDYSNKSIRIDSSKYPNEEFRFIGMEHIEKETGRLLDLPLVKGLEIKSQTIRVPNDFIVFGKLRPYLNKYWLNNTKLDNIICSSEFFVFNIDSQINKSYFINVLSSNIIQDQIIDKTSGARMPRINEDIFFDLKFPLPPKDIQNAIATNVQIIKEKLEKLKLDAVNLIVEAKNDLERAIFN